MSIWAGIGVAMLAAVWLLAAWTRGVIGGRRDREQAAARFADKAGLPAGDPPGEELVSRVIRRNRFVLAGAFLGYVAAFAAPGNWGWALVAGLYVGVAAGAVLARLTEPGPPADSPRVAHATETRLTDYVPPWIVASVGLGAASAVALAAYVLVVREPFESTVPDGTVVVLDAPDRYVVSDLVVVVAAGAAVAAAVAAGLLARLVLSRRRSVVSPAELAVDDALRASAARDCLQLSPAATFAAVAVVTQALTDPSVHDPAARQVGGWAPAILLLAVAVVHLVFDATRGARWWRRRLHPVPA